MGLDISIARDRGVGLVKRTLGHYGFELRRIESNSLPSDAGGEFAPDIDTESAAIIAKVRGFTMTSPERLFALIEAVRYVTRNQIPGDIVECGVWKGGSMMAVAHTLNGLGDQSRILHLFDTFEGMTKPTPEDVDFLGRHVLDEWNQAHCGGLNTWARAGLPQVRQAMLATGYPDTNIRFVKGRVEETIPGSAPQTIAILRLDTDWYESTRHELEHLYDRLTPGGVLILDDYGHFAGARKAVDEFIERKRLPLYLGRVDYSCRVAVKPVA
jgi:O-methyltransferase